MEKRISSIILAALICISSLCAQEFTDGKIRLYLWALRDSYPEYTEEKPYQQAKDHLVSLSEFLLNGMTYGWDFVYTPGDKLRGVKEYFECIPRHTFDDDRKNIEFDSVYLRDDKIFCWVNFNRTPQMEIYYKQMSNIKNPHVLGSGKGKVSKGFPGVEEAALLAIKDGIREYYRKIIKNKPKEISGTILIRKIPAIYIDSGHYVVELDFFLQTSKIKEYSQF